MPTAPTVHPARHRAQITASAVTIARGAVAVLSELDLTVTSSSRIAIVGENGRGKTTLLQVLDGTLTPDSGTVARIGTIGVASQELSISGDRTVGELVGEAIADSRAALSALDSAAAALASDDPTAADAYAAALERAELLDAWSAERRVQVALDALGAVSESARLLSELSVGQRYRVRLACLLGGDADILLLDEPTNHLDRAGLDYMTEQLRERAGGVVIVTHDRALLSDLADPLPSSRQRASRGSRPGFSWLRRRLRLGAFCCFVIDVVQVRARCECPRQELRASAPRIARHPRSVVRMTMQLRTPAVGELAGTASDLARLQSDEWPGFLHPGDLGWHSLVGAEQTASDLRVWVRDGRTVAIGLLDEPDLFRMAVDPSARDDEAVAEHIRRDLSGSAGGVFTSTGATVEARGFPALTDALRADGWVEDEPWTPLHLRLDESLDLNRFDRASVRIASVGPDQAETWIAVHRSAFTGAPLDDNTRTRLTQRWTTMATGPFASLAQHLIAYDTDDVPVAVASVWSAGPGRPGLIEPMGVHSDQQGRGYGVAITLASARALQQAGATNALVVAEGSNEGALATYLASGFVPSLPVADLRRV